MWDFSVKFQGLDQPISKSADTLSLIPVGKIGKKQSEGVRFLLIRHSNDLYNFRHILELRITNFNSQSIIDTAIKHQSRFSDAHSPSYGY